MINDDEKLKFYLGANFFIYEKYLFSNLVRKPSPADLQELNKSMSIEDIEKLYNHFHMSALTEDIEIQRKLAAEISTKWRLFIDKELPNEPVSIRIAEEEGEVVIYVFRVHEKDGK